MVDHHDRHEVLGWSHVVAHVAFALACIAFVIFVGWMVLSKQDSKLYQDDNVVCVSQPFSVQCFERKH